MKFTTAQSPLRSEAAGGRSCITPHTIAGAPAPAALLLLALCLLAGGAQALNDPMDMAALVADTSLPAGGSGESSAPAGYETPIVVNDADQIAPAIYGTRIVWQDWRNGDRAMGDIYSYDLASHLELPEGAAWSDYGKYVPNDYDPAVSGAGIFWVFAGRSDADINNVVLRRTLAGEPVNVTTIGEPGYRMIDDLAIDADSQVYVSGEYGLVRYDTTHGGDYSVRQTTSEIRSPDISGDTIVWQEYDGNDWNIWLYNRQGHAVALANDPGDQVSPAVDGDRVVWQDGRDGNGDIYMFTVSATGPAPVPTPAPLVITSPGTYSITADGYDGNATPIEIRSSDVVLDGGNHTIDGAGRAGSCGVLVSGAGTLSNVVVRNVRLTNWETGIRAANVTGSVIEECDVAHNRVGIALADTRGVEVRDNRVAANDDTGIGVYRSADTTVSANDVLKTGDGFYRIFSTTMDLNTFAVIVGSSNGTEVSGNDLGGEYGSLALSSSDATRVTGNQLTGRWCGIFSLFRSEGGLVADNVFRNSNNLYGAPANASWNVTPSPGPNIVGGPQIGGNFWAKPDGTGFSETHPDAGRDGFCDDVFDNGWGGVDQLPLAPWTEPADGPTPYKPLSVPGRVEAEDYDLGGFSDTTAGNSGGSYRQDGVDIEQLAGQSTPNVGWIRNGEYLAYTANITTAGAYTMTARVASPNSGRTIGVSVDGIPTATITVPNTGSFAAFRTVSVPVTLAAGTHTLKLAFSGDGQNLDRVDFAADGGTVTTPTLTPGAGGASFVAALATAPHGSAFRFTVTPASGRSIAAAWWSFDAPAHLNTWNSRAINPTFYYPWAGTFSPLVRVTYTDGTTEEVHAVDYIRST